MKKERWIERQADEDAEVWLKTIKKVFPQIELLMSSR